MKKRYGIHVGTSSILIIFVVVCMVSFAALSIVSANADYQLTKKLGERETAYYRACSLANEDKDTIDELLAMFRASAESQLDYIQKCLTIEGYDYDTKQVTRYYEVSDIQSLKMVLQCNELNQAKAYEVISWNLVTTGELEYNEKLPVLQP